MKKKLALILAVIVACCTFALAGCSNGGAVESVEGSTWIVTQGKQGDVTVTQEQIEQILGETSYSFEKDGKVIATVMGQTAEGTWKQNGNKVELNLGEDDITLTIDGNKMTVTQNEMTLELTKK